MADFLVALADFDAHRLWIDLGYNSLFAFLQRQLRMSDGAAFYRQTAAHLIQKCPAVVEHLREGRLCLTTVFELSKVVTGDNAGSVLPRFLGISKREAKELVAELMPQPAPERTVFTTPRELPLAHPDRDHPLLGQPSTSVPTPAPSPQEVRPSSPATTGVAPSLARTIVDPKTAYLSRLSVTVSRAFAKKLSAARDALSHKLPGATDGEVLEAALDLVIAQQAKRRHLVKKPRRVPPPRSPESAHIPAHVARAVWLVRYQDIADGKRVRTSLTGSAGLCPGKTTAP